MTKASSTSLTLPVFALLILVGVGVVFLGPQLTGWPVLQKNVYLYPVTVVDSQRVTDPLNAVYNNSLDVAQFNAEAQIIRCPSSRWSLEYNDLVNHNVCDFDGDGWTMVGPWIKTSTYFKRAGSSTRVFSPSNITKVQISSAEAYTSLNIFLLMRCAGSSDSYEWSNIRVWNVDDCSLSECGGALTCRDCRIEPTDVCPSGKWQVNRLVVGALPARLLAFSSAAEALVEWVRVVQNNN